MLFKIVVLLAALGSAHGFAVMPAARSTPMRSSVSPKMQFGFFGGGGGAKEEKTGSGMNARDADFARRQERLAGRQAQGAAQEKGAVECTFPQKGNKVVMAKQGEPLGKVIGRAGLKVKFDCKNGRCGTCQVRLNGRAAAKVCQGATVPGGATRKLKITLDNP